MNRLKFTLIFIFVSLMAVLAIGCGSESKIIKSSVINQPFHKKPNGHFIGYSTPWDWARQDPTAFANALANNGLNYTIIEVDFKRDAAFIANWVKPFRDRGITVEIIAVNWNTRNANIHPTSDFMKFVDELKAKVDPRLIIFHPVTEPGNRGVARDRGKCESWMKYGYDNWSGTKVICVRDSWWGQNLKGKAQYQERHLCQETNDKTIWKGSNKISTNDCSPLIEASPPVLYRQTKLYLKHKSNWCAYHASWRGPVQFDMARITAIGQAIQES